MTPPALVAAAAVLVAICGTVDAQQWTKLNPPAPLSAVTFATGAWTNLTHLLAMGGRQADNSYGPVTAYRLSTTSPTAGKILGTYSFGTGNAFTPDRSAVAQAPDQSLFAFGGVAANGGDSAVLATFNPTSLVWSVVTAVTGPTPTARKLASAVYLQDCSTTVANKPCIVLFGGDSAGTKLSDLYLLWVSETPMRWEKPTTFGPAPTARSSAAGHAHADGRRAYFYAGDTSTGPTSDMFVFAPAGFMDAVPGTAEMTNVALGKATTATAYASSFTPDKVVDGVTTTTGQLFYHSWYNGTYSYGLDMAPYWSVDLGSVTRFDSVTIYQRTDCCFGRNARFDARFSGTFGTIANWNLLTSCGTSPNPPLPPDIVGPSVTFPCQTSSARYFFFRLGSDGVNYRLLTLVEVQVWQRNPNTWRQLSGTANMALLKPAAASSYYDAVASPASKAVDGLTSPGTYPNMLHSGVSLTTTAPVWFRVDLQGVYDINYVRLWGRTDCCQVRNTRSSVLVGFSTDFTFATSCGLGNFDFTPGKFPGSLATDTFVQLSCPQRGRYVFLQRDPIPQVSTDADTNIIALVEIQVWANQLLNQPAPLTGFAFSPYAGGFVMFGGRDASGYLNNAVRFWNSVTNTWLPSSIVQPLGTPPAARVGAVFMPMPDVTYGILGASKPSNQLLLFGGANAVGDLLNDMMVLSTVACPVLDRSGILSESCVGAGTGCTYTCIAGFTLSNKGPLTCRPDGVWQASGAAAVVPPCVPAGPAAPINIVVTPLAGGGSNVSWSPPPVVSYFPVSTYKVSTIAQDVIEDYAPNAFPDATAWTWVPSEAYTTDSYGFQSGYMTIDADANANCWQAGAHNCAQMARMFPSSVVDPTKPWAFEAQLTIGDLLTPTRVAAASQSLSIGLFNLGFNRSYSKAPGTMEFHLGIVATSATAFTVGWEGTRGDIKTEWSRFFSAPSNTVFVRLERNPTNMTWKGLYKFRQSDQWATSIYTVTDSMLASGQPLDPNNIRLLVATRNWGTARAYGAVKYVRIAPIDCANPGSSRIVSALAGNAITMSGLTPGSTYQFAVQAVDLVGSVGALGVSAPTAMIPSSRVVTTMGSVEVAKGKPSSASSQYSSSYPPSYANDGLFPPSNTNLFHSDCKTADGEWYSVDLGMSTAVKSLKIYNRNDCCYTRLNGFEVYLSDSNRWESSTRCDPSLVPYSVMTDASGGNTLPYVATFPCGYNGLTGRYVIVHLPPGNDASTDCYLAITELMVYATNSCPARTGTRATQVPGTNCAAGAPYGAVCTFQCQPGYVQIGGETTATCNGDGWASPNGGIAPPLVCAPICGDLAGPSFVGSCTQTLYADNFTDPVSSITRLLPLEPVNRGLSGGATSQVVKFYVNDGALVATSRLGCDSDLHIAIYSPKIYSYQGDWVMTATISTTYRAGFLFKAQSKDNMYRVYVDVLAQALAVELVVAGVVSSLGSVAVSLNPNLPFTLTVSSTSSRVDVSINNVWVLAAGDRTFTVGYAGFYAATTGTIDDFSFSVPCKGVCSGLTDGDKCTFACQTGLVAVGPATRQCVAPATQAFGAFSPSTGTSFSCTLPPPTFVVSTISVAENSVRNSLVGDPLVGSSSSPDYALQWSIISCTPEDNMTLFYVDSCSGQVKVRTANIDYERQSSYVLLVQASVPPFTLSLTQQNITVVINNVDEPPIVSATTLTVPENSPPRTSIGSPSWSDPENSLVSWSIIADSSGGAFAIDALSGLLSVAANATSSGNYEGINTFSLVVKAVQRNNASLTGSATITISLTDVNDAPLVTTAQLFVIDERNATILSSVGNVTATDEDMGATVSPLSLQLLNVADAATFCKTTDSAQYPTVDGSAGGLALFNVAPSGLLTFGASVPLWYALPAFPFGGLVVRKVYSLCMNVSDGFGGYSYGPVTVAVRAFLPAVPVITGISGATTMQTTGGEAVVFTGTAFGSAGQFTPLFAWYTDANGVSYNATNCRITVTDTEITCNTVPGVGFDFTWTVWQRMAPILAAAPVSTRYAAPSVTGVTGTAIPTTTGGSVLTFSGSNFGPPNTTVTVTFGPTSTEFQCAQILNATVSHTRVRCTVPAGAGAGMSWKLTVGGQSYAASNPAISYPPPVISAVTNMTAAVRASALSTQNALGTDNGLLVTGSNFGPDGTTIFVTLVPGTGIDAQNVVQQSMPCVQTSGATAHTTLQCWAPSGVGRNLGVSISVAGQAATSNFYAPAPGISYKPPVITRISGPGAKNADTGGGQLVFIEGDNLPPLGYAIDPITSVTFGHVGDETHYTVHNAAGSGKASCTVLTLTTGSAPLLQCATPEGVGSGHAWRITIGGQNSSVFLANTSYAAPQVTGFSGAGAVNGDTRGGQLVLIAGRNFGPADNYTQARLAISYGVKLQDGPVGLDKVSYTGASCFVSTPHTEITCNTREGGGHRLAWDIIVDGQVSQDPTTAYAPPKIDSVVLQSTGLPLTAADVRGGQVVVLNGNFFGPPLFQSTGVPLVQAVSYGLSGSEYKLPRSAWNVLGHDTITATLLPGQGQNLYFRVEVADQLSDLSTTSFSFGLPTIESMWPANAPTYSNPRSPNIVTLITRNLPLLDPQSILSFSFGNPGYALDLPLSAPSGPQALAAATNADGTVNVSFALPTDGSGLVNALKITVKSAFTGGVVVTTALTPATVFTYDPPSIDDIIVTKASFVPAGAQPIGDAMPCPFPDGDATWDCQGTGPTYPLVMLTIVGSDLTQVPRDGHPDGVIRTLDLLITNYTALGITLNGLPQEVWNTAPLYVYSWTHTKILAYTHYNYVAGTLRVTVDSPGLVAGTRNQQVLVRAYVNKNPEVSAVIGTTTNIPTTGTPAGSTALQVLVGELSGATDIAVTVGGVAATIVSSLNGYTTLSTAAARAAYVTATLASVGTVIPIYFLVPPGQGANQPIQVFKYKTGSSVPDGSNSGYSVSYTPPTVTAISYVYADSSTAPVPSCCNALTVVTVPTDSSVKLRLTGTNLGTSPTINVGDGYVFSGTPDVVDCSGATPSTHTCYEVRAPQGEGTGTQAPSAGYPALGAFGFRLLLSAGNQDATPVLFRYAPPAVTSITSDIGSFPTRGGARLTIHGINFGYRVPGRDDSFISVAFGLDNDGGSFMDCGNVLRPSDSTSHYVLTCDLPEGSGRNLTARVQIADIVADTPRVLTYSRPNITSISILALDGSSSTTVTSGGRIIAGSTLGSDAVTITGNNFGKGGDLSVNCVFLAWRNRPNVASRVLTCDGHENFLGEGEVASANILGWSHDTIVFAVPPGLGVKDIELSIRGNTLGLDRSDARMFTLAYPAPIIHSITVGNTPPMTSGVLFDTEGGEVVTITGANFGPPARNLSSGRVAGEVFDPPIDLVDAPGVSTAYLAIIITRSTFRLCLSSGRDVFGAQPPVLAGCHATVAYADHTTLVVTSAPGVGLNRSLGITIYDVPVGTPTAAAVPLYTSNAITVDYKKPVISNFFPSSIIYATSESQDLDVYGQQFGNADLADEQGWTLQERNEEAWVGGVSCVDTRRRREDGQTIVTCVVNPEAVPAGLRNFTLLIAGQLGVRDVDSPFSLLIACANGFYAHINEFCLACPAQNADPRLRGAECSGYRSGGSLPRDSPERFRYPRPLSGWYNLNSSDSWTTDGQSMLDACPEGLPNSGRESGRDVCIVPCDPPESCLGDNLCAYGYASKAPNWRCAACITGFYKRAGECIKCPDSPYALFIGFAALVIVVASLGFLLNKRQVNIAVVSIGIDFFQVLAIFSQSRVQWPPIIKELLHVLSAFNLNIEIVAPECLIPDVSYKQKFWFIMLLPLSVGLLLLLSFTVMFLNKAVIKGREKKKWFTHKPTLVSSCLVLIYMLYLYLTRTIMDVFNCTPTMPPDGYTYLQVVFERCGVPGGTQMTLIPYAVAGLVVYTIGYPIFIAYTLYKNRETAMEDQLLRAKGVGNDRLSNPHAYEFRKMFGRAYFQFKPDWCIWIIVIIIRKLCIAVTAVTFNKNASFQMAACLLIMFVAYALQMSARPYMSPGDYDEVLRSHMDSSHTSAIHARLRAVLTNIETRGRKKGHKNLMNFNGSIDRSAVLGVLSSWLFNYNTVEQVMIFAAVIVCLMGIMYQANEVNTYYPESKDSVTAVVLAVIILAILYYVTVLVTEIVILYNERERTKRAMKSARLNAKVKTGSSDDASSGVQGGRGKLVGDDGEINVGKMETQMNPLFVTQNNGGSTVAGLGIDAIMAQRTSPPTELWLLFQSNYADMHKQLVAANEHLIANKREMQLGQSGAGDRSAEGGADKPVITTTGIRRKSSFSPQGTGSTAPAHAAASSLKSLRRAT